MAIDLDDFPYDSPTKRGFEFEKQVRDYLRRYLPDSYVFRGGVLVWDGGYGKEMDFLVAGPKGVIVIEAKQVEDSITGSPADADWVCTAPGMEPRYMYKPLAALRTKCYAVSDKFKNKDAVYQPYKEPLGVFVFSDNARISSGILEINRTSPSFRAVRLSELAEVIEGWRPRRLSGCLPLKISQAKHILGWISKTNRVPKPEMVGAYRILQIDDDKLETDAGVEYSTGLLEEPELSSVRRGKRYEISDADVQNFSERLRQFSRHAKVIEQINHPHVHRYYAFIKSTSGRELWVVEEQVSGESLEDILAQTKRLTPERARKIMLGVAQGLRAVHDRGIVHRELTPRAVLVEQGTDRAVVTNFELAKLLGSPASMTVAGGRLRKNPYRAPEAADNPHAADRKSDVYSWGAVLFQCLTGQKYGGNLADYSGLQKDVRDDLVVCEICLSPSPEDRPQDFADVINLTGWA